MGGDCLPGLLWKIRSWWLAGNDDLRYGELRVVQLKGRAEVHRRTLRGLHSDATLATWWIENGFNIPLGILVHVCPTLRTQHLL